MGERVRSDCHANSARGEGKDMYLNIPQQERIPGISPVCISSLVHYSSMGGYQINSTVYTINVFAVHAIHLPAYQTMYTALAYWVTALWFGNM